MFKMTRRIVLALACLFLVPVVCRAAEETPPPVKVENFKDAIRLACVGDSITQGVGAGKESYPTQLARLLGEKWQVRNFGVSGATLLKKGDKPYTRQKAHAEALAWKPDIVVIVLGTNDSKPQNWKFKNEYAADYKDLIAEFKKANPEVRIYAGLPVPAFPGNWGINDPTIKDEIIPLIRQVAKDTQAAMIDLYAALSGKPECFPDKVHPNAKGAGLMAAEVYRVLTGKTATPTPAGK